MTVPKWMIQQSGGVLVRLHVQPKASRSEVCGEHGEADLVRLKVRVAAPPVDGAANEELIRFLKKVTGLPSSRISIVRGETSRSKDILFAGCTLEEILSRLS